MSRILFVDDDAKYQSVIKNLLEIEGFTVDTANDPVIAIDMFQENRYDLVLTDLIMDTVDGLQLVSLIKRINPHVPVIILTGHEDYRKEVEGFDLDIDDYIYKPTSLEVLIKRINRCLKTKKVVKELDNLYSEKDDINMDLKAHKVLQDNQYIELTVKEFELLAFFLKNKNVAFTREEILENVWRVTSDLIDNRTVDTHVKKLRSKLRINSINSIRGVGYEWFE